jgi:hypothetical protein
MAEGAGTWCPCPLDLPPWSLVPLEGPNRVALGKDPDALVRPDALDLHRLGAGSTEPVRGLANAASLAACPASASTCASRQNGP